jgi:hypothetical protein
MAQWGSNDASSNSVLWAVSQLKKTANSDNQDALYGNTTANAFIDGITTGQFAIDDNEIAANEGAIAHTGWVLRTVGQGGRAGRVMTEVLVAGGISDDAEDTVFPDYKLRITTQPSSASANGSADEQAEFTVVAASTPTGANIQYAWTYANGSALSGGGYSGNTTATLTVDANTVANGTSYKVTISEPDGGAANVTSSNVTITITA